MKKVIHNIWNFITTKTTKIYSMGFDTDSHGEKYIRIETIEIKKQPRFLFRLLGITHEEVTYKRLR